MGPVPPADGDRAVGQRVGTLGTLPVFLLSAQSVFVRQDLDFGAGRFGVVVSAFFAAAALTALLGGGVADRLGRRRSTILAGVAAAGGGLGTALLARSWGSLLLCMVVLGFANAACQVTANVRLARAVPPHRRGLGFGVKGAAIPLAVMLAGLAVPVFAVALSWRGPFIVTGVLGLLIMLSGFFMTRGGSAGGGARSGADRPSLAPLVVTMLAIALASAAANSLASFIPGWSVQIGLTPSEAGLLMAVGSALNVAARVVLGLRADLRHGRNLPVVAAQMAVGAVCLVPFSVGSQITLVPAVLVVFAFGWSWPGLLLYAVVRVGRESPATVSGIVQAGAFVGGAGGPALFGALVAWGGYEVAWRSTAGLFLLSAVLIVVARRMFIEDLVTRPPAESLGFGGGRAVPARTTPSRGAVVEEGAARQPGDVS